MDTSESSRVALPSRIPSTTDTFLRRETAIFRNQRAKITPDWSHLQTFDYQMDYQIQQQRRDRAYFPKVSEPSGKVFKRLQNQPGADISSLPDNSIPGLRIQFFDKSVGMFVMQAQGAVGDCALPGLSINSDRNELSFEWKRLFNQMFGERKPITVILQGAPVGRLHFLNQFQRPSGRVRPRIFNNTPAQSSIPSRGTHYHR